MKLKKIIAVLLCTAQVLGMTVVLAEEDAVTDTGENAVTVAEESDVEAELPLAENELRIYVATDGKDSNSGSFSEPVATIAKGVALAQNIKASNPEKMVTVNIRGGDYYIKQSIKLDSSFNGTENAPFVIQSYNGEEVKIKGSTPITGRFTQVTDEDILKRLPDESKQYVGVYDLKGKVSGLSGYNSMSEMGQSFTGYYELLVDNKAQTLARWPNAGFDRTSNVWGDADIFIGKDSASRIGRWKTATDAVACGYFNLQYAYSDRKIVSWEDNRMHLDARPVYGITGNKRYYVKNLLEELDAPGEYYIDSANSKLYFYPPYKISDVKMELTTMSETMITGTGLSYITFKGIGVQNTRGHAFEFTNSNNITIDNCTMENIGHKAIVMDNVTNAKIINNTISHIGASAVYIEGGDRNSLTSSNNLIDNNHIYDFAYLYRSNAPGLDMHGVGITVTHNLIHSSASQGIWYYGNDHTINYNEFYDLVNEPCDAGAIYSGRNYTFRGNEIAYNYFHDIQTTADSGGSIYVAGVYMDDLNSSANIHHNVFYNCNLAVMIGGGRDNNFDNNIMVDCDTGMFMDARGVGWGAQHALPPDPAVAGSGQAYSSILEVPYLKSPWKERYPELTTILDGAKEDVGKPMNNSIQNNLGYMVLVDVIAPEMKTYGTVDNNYSTKLDNSYFKDYENRNFEIKADSDIAKSHSGLLDIDMSEMGLRADKAAAESKKATEQPFKLILPYNRATDITNLGYDFQWEKNDMATKYIVKIAEDPYMENVILTHETKDTISSVKFIPSGGKPYWWTVTGVNETQSLTGTYEQLGAPRMFTSSTRELLDKTELKANIKILTQLNNAVVEGTEPGTYKVGFKAVVENLLADAQAANTSATVMQKDIEAINDRYDELLSVLKDNINYEVRNVGELLVNKHMWVYDEGYYTFNSDGSLSLKGEEGKQNHAKFMIYDEDLGDNVAIKFGYKNIIGSNYCMIGLHNDASLWTGGYSIIIKSDQIEIQRYVG